jgi:predicted DNA-binding transcriptional regulator AlpA
MRVIAFDQLDPAKGLKYSRVHIMRLVRAGAFPAPLVLSRGRIAWAEQEIDAWLESRPRIGGAPRAPDGRHARPPAPA